MKQRLEFDDENLEQFTPQVREALMRLSREQSGRPEEDPRTPNERLRASLKRSSEAEFGQRVRENMNPDGSIVVKPTVTPRR